MSFWGKLPLKINFCVLPMLLQVNKTLPEDSFSHDIRQWRQNHSGESGPGLTTFWSEQQVRVVINACIIATKLILDSWSECGAVPRALIELLVLVSRQNGISYDFVRWPLHFEFPSYTSVRHTLTALEWPEFQMSFLAAKQLPCMQHELCFQSPS